MWQVLTVLIVGFVIGRLTAQLADRPAMWRKCQGVTFERWLPKGAHMPGSVGWWFHVLFDRTPIMRLWWLANDKLDWQYCGPRWWPGAARRRRARRLASKALVDQAMLAVHLKARRQGRRLKEDLR